nr:MAG TPA: hypothetical protein [Caudoviricetes sp.]
MRRLQGSSEFLSNIYRKVYNKDDFLIDRSYSVFKIFAVIFISFIYVYIITNIYFSINSFIKFFYF